MLSWTGHALVDVGIATLCVMAGEDDPALLTLGDLDAAAEEMGRYYFSGALTSYLTCVFMNSEYVQPGSGTKKDESRKRYYERILRAHRAEPDEQAKGQICMFSGGPATHLIHRGQMPLLTGEGVLNFFPAGAGGLFIAGPYLVALQALPLGGRRSEGKLLVAHSDSPALTLAFAKRFVEDNRRLLALSFAGALPGREGPDERLERENASWDAVNKRSKYPDAKAAFSLIGSDLLKVLEERDDARAEFASLQVYWLSSSGQGPSLEIFSIPCGIIRFLSIAESAITRSAWKRLVGRGWVSDVEANSKKRPRAPDSAVLAGPGRSRNPVLDDLLRIYSEGFVDGGRARRFVRRYLLSDLQDGIEQPGECDWVLATLFLREVLGMSPDRIERIRRFADTLATYIEKRNDAKFFRRITFARYPWALRGELVKAQRHEFLQGRDLLYSLDTYLGVFEGEDGSGLADWSLMRDLICIRLVEQLYKAGWLTAERLTQEPEEEEQAVRAGE